jgi:hypothetical protein
VNERFWPLAEAAQADYEALRAAALTGEAPRDELAAARFARRGLAGAPGHALSRSTSAR